MLNLMATRAGSCTWWLSSIATCQRRLANPAGRSRKAGTSAADHDELWDWQVARSRVLTAAATLLSLDCRALFKGLSATEPLVNACLEMVRQQQH
jgi:non-SMC mitotic condensation complex subunit 1, N-term